MFPYRFLLTTCRCIPACGQRYTGHWVTVKCTYYNINLIQLNEYDSAREACEKDSVRHVCIIDMEDILSDNVSLLQRLRKISSGVLPHNLFLTQGGPKYPNTNLLLP